MLSSVLHSSSVPIIPPTDRRHEIRRAKDYTFMRARHWAWVLAIFLIIESASAFYFVVFAQSRRFHPTTRTSPRRCDMAEYTWVGFHRMAVPE
jgi:hypothetical protein